MGIQHLSGVNSLAKRPRAGSDRGARRLRGFSRACRPARRRHVTSCQVAVANEERRRRHCPGDLYRCVSRPVRVQRRLVGSNLVVADPDAAGGQELAPNTTRPCRCPAGNRAGYFVGGGGAGQLTVGGPGNAVDSKLDLQQILQTLGPEHREVLILRELQGLSYAEIAELLKVPRGTVESRLHRARNELRQRLNGYMEA